MINKFLAVATIFAAGCVSNADKLVVEDIRQASALIEEDAKQLQKTATNEEHKDLANSIASRAYDTREGAETLQRNLTGAPNYNHTYTPQSAEEHRAQSDASAKTRSAAFDSIISVVGGLSGFDISAIITLIITLLGGGMAVQAKRKADEEADSGVDSTAIALEGITSKAKKQEILNKIKDRQERAGVRDRIKRRLRK